MRVGIGYDVHRFAPDRRLVLGGVEIPHSVGLLGHSDADVLLHAIADAILGAAALGDIGLHFPPSDPAFRDANSLELLAESLRLVAEAGYRVGNVDATIIAEAPRVLPHAPEMRVLISEALRIEVADVSIKATTNEGMGFVGREEGIAALAIAILFPISASRN